MYNPFNRKVAINDKNKNNSNLKYNDNNIYNKPDINLSDEEVNYIMDLVDETNENQVKDNKNKYNENNKMNYEQEIIKLKKEVNFIKLNLNDMKNILIELNNNVNLLKKIKVNQNKDSENLINSLNDLRKVISDANEYFNEDKIECEEVPKKENKQIIENKSNENSSDISNGNIDSSNENDNQNTKYKYTYKQTKNFLFKYEGDKIMKKVFEKYKTKKETENMKMIMTENVFGRNNFYLELNFKDRYKFNLKNAKKGVFIDLNQRKDLENELKNGKIIGEYNCENN